MIRLFTVKMLILIMPLVGAEAIGFIIEYSFKMGNTRIEVETGEIENKYNGWKDVNLRQAILIIIHSIQYKQDYSESKDDVLNIWNHKFRIAFEGIEDLETKTYRFDCSWLKSKGKNIQ